MLAKPPLDQTAQQFALNTARGITNIGSHPENDIVVNGPGMVPFHLMLDHRQRPYRVILLNPEAEARINGLQIASGEPVEISDLNGIQFGGFRLQAAPTAPGSEPGPVVVVPHGTPPGWPESTGYAAAGMAGMAAAGYLATRPGSSLPADLSGAAGPSTDTIMADALDKALSTMVDQTAVFHVSIANGGAIVASFEVAVEGVPHDWIEIVPARINLYEGSRGTFEVRVTPPRDPASLAKTYPLRFIITSSNYPGIYGEAHSELTILPFYGYSVGNLTPRNQSISYHTKFGKAVFPITNTGNSPCAYNLAAQDDENGLQFGFAIDEASVQLKQAQVTIPAGGNVNVPLQISPLKRRLVHLKGKSYQFSVTTQPSAEGIPLDAAGARMIAGSLNSRPMFGFFSIFLAVALILFGLYQLIIPRIYEFSVKDRIIRLGEPALLRWNVSAFTTNLQIPNVTEAFKPSQRQVATIPTSTVTTYSLSASNWLSSIFGMDIRSPQSVTVLAIPSYPVIDTFTLDRVEIFEGDEVILKWSTLNARSVLLTVEGVTTPLTEDVFSGDKAVKIYSDSLVTLEAINNSGSVIRSAYVHAIKPNPAIKYFTITPPSVVQGGSVTISWAVEGEGIESVMISPFKDALPPSGKLTFFPAASMEFVMTVKSRGEKQLDPLLRSVGVLPPPGAPVINFFKGVPVALVTSGNVELSWSVTGATTDIVLTSTEGEIAKGLPAQGFKTIAVTKTTSLMLIAYNGDLSQAAAQDIVVASLKPVKVTIDSVVPATPRRVGDSVFATVSVRPLDSKGAPKQAKELGYPEVGGTILVTDGFSSCEFDLPKTGCELTLEKIVSNDIVATFMGDENYARTSSAPYTELEVVGYPVEVVPTITLSGTTTPATDIVVGEAVGLSFVVRSTDSKAPGTMSGKVTVYDVVGTTATAICSDVNLNSTSDKPMEGSGSCAPLSFSTTGTKSLRFSFFDSDTFQPTNKYDNTLTVTGGPVTVSILSDLSVPTVTGQAFPIKVSVAAASPATGIPGGSVTITDQDYPSDSCTITLVDGGGTCPAMVMNQVILSSGKDPVPINHTLVAVYNSSNGSYLTGQATTQHKVVPAETSAVIDPGSGPFSFGKPTTVRVTLSTDTPGSGIPTGIVAVTLGSSAFCTTTITNGSNTCTGIIREAGTLEFEASYPGNINYNGSIANPLLINSTQALTTIDFLPDLTESTSAPGGGELVTFYYSVGWTNPPISVTGQPSGSVKISGNAPGNESATCPYVYNSSNPIQSCEITLTIEGSRPITANFTSSQSNDIAGSSDLITYFVKKSTQISLYGYPSTPTIAGQEVAFYYAVTSETHETPSGGTVTITASYPNPDVTGQEITINCENVPNTNFCLITFPKALAYRIDYNYSGDGQYYSPVTGAPFTFTVTKAGTMVADPVFSRTPLPINQEFRVNFQVLNLDTNLVPFGTAYLIAHQNPVFYNCAIPTNLDDEPNNLVTLNSTTGTGSTLRTLTSAGTWYFTAYYPGNEDFEPSCTTIPVLVP